MSSALTDDELYDANVVFGIKIKVRRFPTALLTLTVFAQAIVIAFVVFTTSAVALWRRSIPPLASRNIWLLIVSTFGLWAGFIRDMLGVSAERCWCVCVVCACFSFVFVSLCFRFASHSRVSRAQDVPDFLADHFLGTTATVIGLRLWLIDRFERKKKHWLKKRISPELVCVCVRVCVFARVGAC